MKRFICYILFTIAAMTSCQSRQTKTEPNADIPTDIASNHPQDNRNAPSLSPCDLWTDQPCPDECKDGCYISNSLAEQKIAEGVDVNAQNAEGKTPIMFAKDAQTIKTLIAGGADINAKDKDGNTALLNARDVELVKALIADNADINAKDKDGDTSLLNAEDVDLVKTLIADKADVNSRDEQGKTPLILASSESGDDETIKALIAAGADVNAKDDDGRTPLSYAASVEENLESVKALIAAGANVNHKDKRDKTPLMYATDSEVAKALIAAGADVNAKDKFGDTALLYAEESEVVKALIEAGADVNVKDKFSGTALIYASDADIVKMLIDAGADVNAKDNRGITALMKAEEPESVKALIAAGADINAKDKIGRTVLWYALADRENGESINALIEAGVEVNADDIKRARKNHISSKIIKLLNTKLAEPLDTAKADVAPEPAEIAKADVAPEPLDTAEAEVAPKPAEIAKAEVAPEPADGVKAENIPDAMTCDKWPKNALFQQNHEFIYHIETEEYSWNNQENVDSISFDVICRVTQVTSTDEACTSVVSCMNDIFDRELYSTISDNIESYINSSSIEGKWGINEKGIFHGSVRQDSTLLFDMNHHVIDLKPKRKLETDCEFEDIDDDHCNDNETLEYSERGWCMSSSSRFGDDSGEDTYCIDLKRGFTYSLHEQSDARFERIEVELQ